MTIEELRLITETLEAMRLEINKLKPYQETCPIKDKLQGLENLVWDRLMGRGGRRDYSSVKL